MVQKISLKAGQGVVQMILEGRTVLKVVEVPTSHQTPSHVSPKPASLPPRMLSSTHAAQQSFAPTNSHQLGIPAQGYTNGIPVKVKTFTPPTVQQQQQQGSQLVVKMTPKATGLPTIPLTTQQLADLQARFPSHMVPKTTALPDNLRLLETSWKPPPKILQGPLSSVKTPLIINSNGLRGYRAPLSANEPKIQPNQQPKPVSSTGVLKPSSAPSSSNPPIPSWAPGGSKPLIKQVKTSSGKLVWAQAVSSEQIPGSDKAVFKFKALGPVDPNNPNTPPPALKPETNRPCKEPTIQPKKTQGASLFNQEAISKLVCPFANCSEAFSTLGEMDIHGSMHGDRGEKGSCPHCKIGYNRWGNLFNHVFKGTGCTQQGLPALPGPFLCPACAEEAVSASALRLHCETKHSSVMPTCPGCGITYNRWGNLLNHIFGPSACPLATPRPPTMCTACGGEFGTLHKLHQHLLDKPCRTSLILNRQSLFQCLFPSQPACGKLFPSGTSLSNHISTVHESRSGVARRNQVASAYASGDVDANTRTTLLRQITSSRPTSSLEALPTPLSSRPPPLATYSVLKRKKVMPRPAVMVIFHLRVKLMVHTISKDQTMLGLKLFRLPEPGKFNMREKHRLNLTQELY